MYAHDAYAEAVIQCNLPHAGFKSNDSFSGLYIYTEFPGLFRGCMRADSTWRPWVSGLVGHFVQTWPDSELLSHSAVLRL